ncbi:MAG TPA: hypothetical protein VJM31_12715 [Vicinamibacterales bacterium]|nr:hypothetical protein [Vicinamibacterales bacterium]
MARISFAYLIAFTIVHCLPAPCSAQSDVQAQSDVAERARRQLRSGEPRSMAWGAFHASAYQVTEVIPDLIAALETSAVEGFEQSATIDALLDAAVQLDAKVPASALVRYWERWPVQTSILFAKATNDRDAVILDLLRTASGFRWYALANLLLHSKPPGFAAQLFDKLDFRLTVTVSEEGNKVSGHGAGFSSLEVSDGIGVSPDGYPPTARYRFELGPRAGYIVVSVGPTTVYYTRSVSAAKQFAVSDASIDGPDATERLRYVEALVGRDQMWVRVEESATPPWRGAKDLFEQVAALKGSLRRRYDQQVAVLVRAGLVSKAEAESLSHTVSVSVFDARDDRSVPLPVID